ncbi:MAG: DUF1559 domain-containing protein [Pirellulales bacterium]|nr:DUF1559 domain-containing protein [Pirellulales bacterium]
MFFFAAATLALFGSWGIWIAIVLGAAALAFNRSKTTMDGMIRVTYIVLIGIVCPGLLKPAISGSPEAARRARCANNMKLIGFALLDYENARSQFPTITINDKSGKPLYSWLVKILPGLERRDIYDRLKKDESWDGPHNAKILRELKIWIFDCPSAFGKPDDFSSYLAIVGPGTIWRKEGPVSLNDLRDPAVTVMAVECAESDMHWAEPYTLTAEEALERMKTGKGMRISTAHPSVVNVLFADGHVEPLRADMPISLWRKLLMGEIKSIGELESWEEDPNDPSPVNMSVYKSPPKTGEWAYLLSILVWLISLALIFYRAWDSRKIAKAETRIEADAGLNEP